MLRARMRPRLPARGCVSPCVRQSSNNASRSQPRQPGSSFKPRRPSTGAASQSGPQSLAQSSSSSTSTAGKQPLPAVPVLSTHPSIVISDAFFAGDRPLLELGIPPSQRQNSSSSSATEQSRSLDDMLEEALEWFDPRHSSQGDKSAASSPSGSGPIVVKREPAAAATEELARHTPFVAPHQHHKRKLSQRRQRLMARFDQAEHFLSSVHTRLDHPSHDARMALDSFFHHGQKLADLLPSKKLSNSQQQPRQHKGSKEAKQLTAEDVTELMHITQAAMEHWKSDSDGSSRLFTMEKDADTGVWSTTEANPSAKPASSSNSNSAQMTVEEDADVDLDLAADEGEQILVVDHRGNQQMFGSDINNSAAAAGSSNKSSKVPQSLAQAISSFVNALPSETAHEQPASSTSTAPAAAASSVTSTTTSPTLRETLDGKRPAGGMGRRISLGPRLSTIRGGRAIPRVRRSLDQLLGWTSAGIRADSVKKKRKRKMSKHKYKKRRKATRALRKKLGK